jgi:outer membrane protein assembly factor BamB
VWSVRRRDERDHLNRFWNAVAAARSEAEVARLRQNLDHLDPTLSETVERLRARDDARRPDPVFLDRLEQTLMDASLAAHAGSVPLPPVSPGHANGRSAPRERWAWLPALPVSKERRRWALAQCATALLLLVTLLAVWFAFRPEEDHGIVGPGGTPTALPAPVLPSVPMFRGDPARTGVMPGPGPTGEPVVRWRYEAIADGRVNSQPAVVDGVVYAGAGDYGKPGVVLALDAATGALRWTTDLPGEAVSSPAVAGGLVYIASVYDGLYALDAATGAVRWQAPLPSGGHDISSPAVVGGTVYVGDMSSPAVVDGVVYCGGGAGFGMAGPGQVSAFDAATGAPRWQTEMPGAGIAALDAATGAVQWVFATGAPVVSSPAVAGGLVYAGDDAGYLHAVDIATGRERWQAELGAVTSGAPAIAAGVVYAGSANGRHVPADLVALDAATGAERWRFRAGGGVGSPALVDGVVFVGSGDHRLYALDAATGELLWALELDDDVGMAPAVVGGTVYVGTGFANNGRPGYVYAIGGGPAATPVGTATS